MGLQRKFEHLKKKSLSHEIVVEPVSATVDVDVAKPLVFLPLVVVVVIVVDDDVPWEGIIPAKVKLLIFTF